MVTLYRYPHSLIRWPAPLKDESGNTLRSHNITGKRATGRVSAQGEAHTSLGQCEQWDCQDGCITTRVEMIWCVDERKHVNELDCFARG